MYKKASFSSVTSGGGDDPLWDSDDDDLFLCEAVAEETRALSQTTSQPTRKISSQSKAGKPPSSWISSSFDGFGESGQLRSRKRPRSQIKDQPISTQSRNKKMATDDLWVDKYKPTTQADLAVHKKKITEVQSWIEASLRNKTGGSMCLLTGPAGVGKTATVHALAADLKLEVQEWSNPVTTTTGTWSKDFQPTRPELSTVGGSWSESQSSQFKDFLLRADRYPTLQLTSERHQQQKIILIEEFPNIFSRNVTLFHDILRQHARSGCCPLVFVVSDTTTGESYERILFPKDSQVALGMHNISFNPVATTNLVKVLQRIASTEAAQRGNRYQVPNKSTLESLSETSGGDLRSAINALQFAALKGCGDVSSAVAGRQQPGSKVKSKAKVKASSRSGSSKSASLSAEVGSWRNAKGKVRPDQGQGQGDLAAIGGRDTSLFLFRALGKVLYCKRMDPKDDPNYVRLPPHLAHHEREPLLITPEDVIDKSHLSGDCFTAFLHENYLPFFPELDDVLRAAQYLSDSDRLATDWANRSVLSEYAASVASRGLMHANSARSRSTGSGTSGLGFKPLHKPGWYSTVHKMRENCAAARGLFRGHGHSWTPEELQTQLLPYLYLTKVTVNHPAQVNFLQTVCRFSTTRAQYRPAERLQEKDFAIPDSDDESDLRGQPETASRPSQTNSAGSAVPSGGGEVLPPGGDESDDGDNFIIEDFDD